MPESIKSVSMEQIEKAIGAALSELLGEPTTVNVHKLELVQPSPVAYLTGKAADQFHMEITGATPREEAGRDVPF